MFTDQDQDTKCSGLSHTVEFGHRIIDVEFRSAVRYTKKTKKNSNSETAEGELRCSKGPLYYKPGDLSDLAVEQTLKLSELQ